MRSPAFFTRPVSLCRILRLGFTIATEIVSGIAFLIGAFVSLVSIPAIILLAVAIFTVHLPYGFSSIKLISV